MGEQRRTSPWRFVAGWAVVAVAVAAPPAEAVTANACLAGKLGDVAGAVAARAACRAKDAKAPSPAGLAACLARAERRFDGGDDPTVGRFAKRERRPPCVTTGDQVGFAIRIATYVDEQAAALGLGPGSGACDGAKLTCVGRYVQAVLGCVAKAAKGPGAIDVRCLARARTRLGAADRGCLGTAVTRGGCSVSGDAGSLADAADAFAAESLCALDPPGAACPGLPTPVPTPTRTATPVPTRTPTPVVTPNGNDPAQRCVDIINEYRASIGRPPFARWTAAESCADDQAADDSQTGQPHGAFGQCGEWAQNECPNWPGPPSAMIENCLAMMWAEGPGSDYSQHGHYINMSSTSYTKVACGFVTLPNGRVWAVQDFQ